MSLFDIAKLEQELSELEEKTANSEFWTTNNEETKKVLSEIKRRGTFKRHYKGHKKRAKGIRKTRIRNSFIRQI